MTKFEVGDLVRKVGGGDPFLLEDVNDNPNYKADDEYYAMGSGYGGYNNIDVNSPDEIELVMDKEQAAKRKIPSKRDIAKFLSSVVHQGLNDSFSVSESEADGKLLVVSATTDEGLEFSFEIEVRAIYEGEAW